MIPQTNDSLVQSILENTIYIFIHFCFLLIFSLSASDYDKKIQQQEGSQEMNQVLSRQIEGLWMDSEE